MVIMVTNMTNNEPTNDDETRTRMRKRFQEIDEQQKKIETASSVWVWVFFFGFLISFIGVFMMLFFLGVIPLSLEIIISAGVIIFGTFFMAVAGFIKGTPRLILEEM